MNLFVGRRYIPKDYLFEEPPMTSLWSGTLATRLRIASGLVLFTYALTHFSVIGLGLFSAEVMEQAQTGRMRLTRSFLGNVQIYGSFLTHAGLAIGNLAGGVPFVCRGLRLFKSRWALRSQSC